MFSVPQMGRFAVAVVLAAAAVRGDDDGELRRRLSLDDSVVAPDYVLRLEAQNYDSVSGNWIDSSGRGNDAVDVQVEVHGAWTHRTFYHWTCCRFHGQVSRFVDALGYPSDGSDETLRPGECKHLCAQDDECVAFEMVSTDVPIWHQNRDPNHRHHHTNKRVACKLHYQDPEEHNPFLTMLKCRNPEGVYSSCAAKSVHIAEDLGALHWDSPRKDVADNGEPVVRFRTPLEDLLIMEAQTGIKTGDARTLCFKMAYDVKEGNSHNAIFGTAYHRAIDFGKIGLHEDYAERLRLRSIKTWKYDGEDDHNTPEGSVPSGVHSFCIQGDAERTLVWMDGQVLEEVDQPLFDYPLQNKNIAVGSSKHSRKYGKISDLGFVGDIYEMILYPRWLHETEVENIQNYLSRFD